jgi:hypothetical protein
MEQKVFFIPTTQCFLEMARSIIYSNIRHNNEVKEEKIDRNSSFTFAFASLTTIYSYLAVESFTNYNLYNLWRSSRYNHQQIEEINRLHPELNAKATYDDFYQEYGKLDDFVSLKNTQIGKMKEKLKVLCKEFNFPQIYDKEPKLWQEFLELLENTRDFLVHPNPEEDIFQKYCKQLVNTEKPFITFPEVAAGLIKYFYENSNSNPPSFLEKNELFFISEIVKM